MGSEPFKDAVHGAAIYRPPRALQMVDDHASSSS